MGEWEYRGVRLGRKELATIQGWVDAEPWLTREELARRACRRFGWRRPDGRWAVRGSRNFLVRLGRRGVIRLPALRRAGNYFERRRRPWVEGEGLPAEPAGDQVVEGELAVRPVASEPEQVRWHRDMARWHYLSDRPLVGESLCYTAWVGSRVVAHLGWASASLHNPARDRYLGWDEGTKRRCLPVVVSNVRFLIVPGVEQRNLASRILAANCRRLVADWRATYGHEVWLAETFVDPVRFRGTCYRAANWVYVGETRGFSRRGASYESNGCPKLVFVYPLVRAAQDRLCRGEVCGVVEASTAKEEAGTMVDVERLPLVGQGGLFELFGALSDRRKRRGKRHTIGSVLALAAIATLCGARSLAAIAQFARELPEAARRRLGCRPLRPPSEATFRRVLKTIDVAELDRRLGQWAVEHSSVLGEALALDGKTLRGSAADHEPPVHLLSALVHDSGVVVAQSRVPDNTNEIKAVVPLLENLDLEGAVVTGDALMTQREIARYVVEDKGADYLFTVKDNQRTLRQAIQHLGHGAFSPSAAARRDRR